MREFAGLLGDRLVSRLDLTLDPKAVAGRRIEVITGGGGRRRWSETRRREPSRRRWNPTR
jgi:hypothetical protein